MDYNYTSAVVVGIFRMITGVVSLILGVVSLQPSAATPVALSVFLIVAGIVVWIIGAKVVFSNRTAR